MPSLAEILCDTTLDTAATYLAQALDGSLEDNDRPGAEETVKALADMAMEIRAHRRLIAAAPALAEALEALLRECFMTHKHWGNRCNRDAAEAAQDRARAALALLNP